MRIIVYVKLSQERVQVVAVAATGQWHNRQLGGGEEEDKFKVQKG